MQQTLRDDDRVMSLVETALTKPPTERQEYIAEVCGDDTQLLSQVREYLVWEEQMDGFLLEPVCRRREPERPFGIGDLLLNRFRIVREVRPVDMWLSTRFHADVLWRR
jgi:hypothetical protein